MRRRIARRQRFGRPVARSSVLFALAVLGGPEAAASQEARATLEATVGLLGGAFDDELELDASATHVGVRLGAGLLVF